MGSDNDFEEILKIMMVTNKHMVVYVFLIKIVRDYILKILEGDIIESGDSLWDSRFFYNKIFVVKVIMCPM